MNKIKLGEILKVKHGFAFKSQNYVNKSEFVLVTLANISSTNNFQFNEKKLTYYNGEFSNEYILNEDDLIIPLTEQVIGLFGNTAFIPKVKGISFLLNQRVGKIIPIKNRANNYYLHYLLATDLVRKQLEHRASGTKQRNISPNDVYDVTVFICDVKEQKKIGELLYNMERKINLNNKINDNLFSQISIIYNYWFTQYEFPNTNGKSYKSNNGELYFNNIVKKDIPKNWVVETLASNSLSEIIKPGVDLFEEKIYYTTADIVNKNITNGSIVSYNTKEDRANMQPIPYSVWFAKMKNTIKHLFLTPNMKFIIENSILSTGLCGLKCKEIAFEYISSYILHPYFENHKDVLSHGATQEAVNNDDLNYIYIIVPEEKILRQYHNLTKSIFKKIAENMCENKELITIRDFLLPLLMNGQATISE